MLQFLGVLQRQQQTGLQVRLEQQKFPGLPALLHPAVPFPHPLQDQQDADSVRSGR